VSAGNGRANAGNAPWSSAAGVVMLVMDVDGVLTDGSILIDDHGRETKRFNVRDGAGLRAWAALGFHAAVITGRAGAALQHRMAELGIADVVQGSKAKGPAIEALCARRGVDLAHVAYVGDDWPDLGALRVVGYPMAVGDADNLVKSAAAFVTGAPGGRGAVRQAVEHLLEAKGLTHRAAELLAGTPACTAPAGTPTARVPTPTATRPQQG
jgi:3-deoxy-D-manno-octulosonate 8-phosphate phosphatase (KDO 8-P phosphatase)